MQNARKTARNDQITGRGEETREAGTDVSWRNGASVQQRQSGSSTSRQGNHDGRDNDGRMR